MPTDLPLTDRNAGRVVLLDPDDRVLLLCCGEPGDPKRWWITPGGGCEPGESFAEAALREAEEELGFGDLELGPCVWTRVHTFPWLGKVLRQHEHFFVCRVAERMRMPSADSHTPEELLYLHGHRWWSVSEIEEAARDGVAFAPRKLGALLLGLLSGGAPAEPVDVGV